MPAAGADFGWFRCIRFFGVFAAAGLWLAAAVLAPGAGYGAASPSSSPWIILSERDGSAVSVAHASDKGLAEIRLEPLRGGPAQSWFLESVFGRSGNDVAIRSVKSRKVMDVRGYDRKDEARIQQFRYFGSRNQIWRIRLLAESSGPPGGHPGAPAGLPDDLTGRRIQLIARHSGKCLKALPGKKGVHSLRQGSCRETPDMTWHLRPNPHAVTVFQLAAVHSGLVMAPAAAGAASGDLIQVPADETAGLSLPRRALSFFTGSARKKMDRLWTRYPTGQIRGRTTYTLISRGTGHVLDVAEAATTDRGRVQLFPFHQGYNQLWYIDEAAGGLWQVESVLSGKCLDVREAAMNPGAVIQQFTCHGGPNQQWRPLPADLPAMRQDHADAPDGVAAGSGK